MIDTFTKWLNNFPEFAVGTEAREMLDDAMTCYVHDIPRPALILSYLAFCITVKENILSSSMPSGHDAGRWSNRMSNLRSDDKWEEELQNCVAMQRDKSKTPVVEPVFDIPDHLREDFKYWKNRRNDCAHYKRNIISLSHVCAFWQFMMSKYIYFQPQGSMSKSIQEYKDYFDLSITPAGTDQTTIFNHLCAVLRSTEDLRLLFKAIKRADTKQKMELLHRLLHNTESTKAYAKAFITEEDFVVDYYLSEYLDDLSMLYGDDPKQIRAFWYNSPDIPIYSESLKAHLIPDDQIKESLSRVLSKMYQLNRGIPWDLSEDNKNVLKACGFIDAFFEEYYNDQFISRNYKEMNQSMSFYVSLISLSGVDKRWVEVYCRRVDEGKSFPYALGNWFASALRNGDLNKDLYLQVVTDLGLANPIAF